MVKPRSIEEIQQEMIAKLEEQVAILTQRTDLQAQLLLLSKKCE